MSLKYDEKVWEIEKNLHTYISVLILHHVIDSCDTPEPVADDTFFDVREKRVAPFVACPESMQELEDGFHDAAWSQVTTPTILFLAGDKGVGKTQLALEYCYQAHLMAQFRTVFWLDASSLENLCLGFEGMYATIRRSMDGSRAEKIRFVREFLSDLWHPWLLVLDNYETAALYNNILEFLPSRGYGGILLVTRGQVQGGLGRVLQVPKFIPSHEQAQLDTLLAQEVQRKNFEGIQNLVNQGADVNTMIWKEWPCLHRAALFGLDDAVTLLLERGASLNPPSKIRKPLYWAASGGHESTCVILLDHEDATGSISSQADNEAALNVAAEQGHLGIAELLLRRREANLNTRNQYGRTPLQSAAKEGHTTLVKLLVDRGALSENHSQGDQAVLSAASAGHFEIVKILCSEGKVKPDVQDDQGRTVLCSAAESKDSDTREENGLEMAIFLLGKGADPNPPSGTDGPLQIAAMHGHLKMVRLLLEHGADPTRDGNGWTPLTNAIKYKSLAVIPLLLQAEVGDSAIRDKWLEGSLRYACRLGDREVVLQLIKAGADINAAEEKGNPKGATPLLLTILNGHVKCAQLLIRQGARQDLADGQGRLPLPLAAENGYETLVRDLIRAGGDPNMKSGVNEDTPLILAAAKDKEKVVKVLLENGADRDLTNKFGDMALDIAEEKGIKKVIELLES